ncbi:MAG: ABC transporter substrate-binding protein [Deltaproteobacteria bacterium]|nr:ABC transporter substrate-binding protein [Deltaproteobacteria bacterium]
MKSIAGLLSILLVLVLLITVFACTAKPEKHYHIAIVIPKSGTSHGTDGFIASLDSRGYVSGENTTFYFRENNEGLEDFINRMVERKVDLIFTITTPVTRTVKKLTEKKEIPVIFVVNNPVNSNIVESIKHPGGNLTGIQLSGSTPKTLEWLKSIFHDMATIWVPVSFDTKAALQCFNELEKAAKKLDVKILLSEVTNKEELIESLQSIPAEAEAVFTFHSILINSNLEIISKKAIEKKLPVASSGHVQYKKGALLSYGVSHYEAAFHAGRLAESVLQGARPSHLPVEMADFFLGLNLQTASRINVHIADHVIDQANFVIQ